MATSVVGAITQRGLIRSSRKIFPGKTALSQGTSRPVARGMQLGALKQPSHPQPFTAMLRISIHEPAGQAAALRLEGQIAGAWTAELDRVCARLLAEGRRLTLDLADVTFIDRLGLTLLASLSHRGVALLRCSPFQKEQLRMASSPKPGPTL